MERCGLGCGCGWRAIMVAEWIGSCISLGNDDDVCMQSRSCRWPRKAVGIEGADYLRAAGESDGEVRVRRCE